MIGIPAYGVPAEKTGVTWKRGEVIVKRTGLLLLAGLAVIPATALYGGDSGPVLRLELGDVREGVVRDRSGNGHDARVFGARRVAVGKGHALEFDGVDDLKAQIAQDSAKAQKILQ